MRLLNAMLVGLLELPVKVRLSIVVPCFLPCLLLYALSQFYGPLFALPVGLAVLIFKRRGAFIGIGLTMLALAVVNCITIGGILWPRPLLTGFITGAIALLTEGFFIGYLRYLLDMAEAARVQVLQKEQQRLIAYEQRMEALQAEQRMVNAYEQQRQLNQLKDQFIMNVSHELRTPLTAVYGWLELLATFREQQDTSMQATYLSKAMDRCQELIHLVNNVLETVHVTGDVKHPQPEECLVAQAVCEELEHFDPREVQAHTIQIDVPEQLSVWADQQYLRQVLRNLLSNAFKYAPQHTSVVISATLYDTTAQRTDSAPHVCICVKDAGPGIPPAELPLLFEKFVRLERDLAGPVRGSGLGLYISKQLVETMGGHIWAESTGRAGEGSRFYFTLPSTPHASLPPLPTAS